MKVVVPLIMIFGEVLNCQRIVRVHVECEFGLIKIGANMSEKFEPPILKALDELYEKYHKKIQPLFPYDKKTNTIHLELT